MSRRRSRIIETLVSLDLAAAALLVAIMVIPAYFNFQSSISFEPDKGALLRSLATVVLLLFAWETVMYLRAGHRPSWSQFSLPVKLLVGYVFVIVISTLAGIDFVTSVWGNYERGYGLLSILAGITFAVVAYRMARSGQQWLLVDAILLAAVVPMLYGLLQVSGYDPVIGQTIGFELGQRASSTLGNPLFLADFLLLVIPLGLARLVLYAPRTPLFRIALGVYLFLLVLTLIATKSLTALGASITAGAMFLVAVGKLQQRRWFTASGLLVLAGGFALLILAWTLPGLLPWRLGDIFASGSSGGQRLLIWQAVLDLMRAELRWLLTGLGPDALPLKIAPYLSPEFAHFEVDWALRLPDRAHTWPLDLLSVGGVLALVLWVLFLIAVMAKLMPVFPKRAWLSILIPAVSALLGVVVGALIWGLAAVPIGLVAGMLGGVLLVLLWAPTSAIASPKSDLSPYLLAAWVGHLLYIAFSFSTHAPDLLLWIIVGLTLAGGQAFGKKSPQARQQQHQPGDSSRFLLAGIALAIAGFSFGAVLPEALLLWFASLLILFIIAWMLSLMHSSWYLFFIPSLVISPAVLCNMQTGLSSWLAYTWILIWLLVMIWLLLPAANRRAQLPALAALFPILILLNLPMYGDIAYKSAIPQPSPVVRAAYMDRAILLSPQDHAILRGIAYVETRQQAPDATLAHPRSPYITALFQRAQQAQPLAPESSSAYGEWLRQRALVDEAAMPLAFEAFKHTLDLSPNDIETRNRLALLRWQSGDSEGAISDLEALLAVDPLYGPTYLNLAMIQTDLGDLDSARAIIEAGVIKVPWWPALQDALDGLQ